MGVQELTKIQKALTELYYEAVGVEEQLEKEKLSIYKSLSSAISMAESCAISDIKYVKEQTKKKELNNAITSTSPRI